MGTTNGSGEGHRGKGGLKLPRLQKATAVTSIDARNAWRGVAWLAPFDKCLLCAAAFGSCLGRKSFCPCSTITVPTRGRQRKHWDAQVNNQVQK